MPITNNFRVRMSLVALSSVLAVALAGCGGSSSSSSNDRNQSSQVPAVFAISDARALLIGPDDSVGAASVRSASMVSTASAESSDRLFKVTDSGYVEEVTATDADGNTITNLSTPTAIYDVSDEFLVVAFGSTHYLLRREDGAAFDLEAAPADLWGERIVNRSPFRTDADGNIYFVREGSEPRFSVQKITGATGGNVTRTRITPEADDVYSFAIGSAGHVAYTGSPQSRVMTPAGGLHNISNQTEAVWTAPDGKLHFSNGSTVSQVVTAEDGSVSVSKYGDLPKPGAFHLTYFLHEVGGRLYLVERRDSNGQLVLELFNEDGAPRLVEGLPLEAVQASAASDSHLYLAGTDDQAQPRLLKLEPVSGTTVDLLTPNTYDVYEVSVSNSGIVTFGATQMSNGARVVGEVDAQGNLILLNESLSRDITVLVRVN